MDHANNGPVPLDKQFILSDGRRISSLEELAKELYWMQTSVFSSHVNPSKNDFASWIEGVFNNPVLAQKARQARSKEELARIIASSFIGKKTDKLSESANIVSIPQSTSSEQAVKPKETLPKAIQPLGGIPMGLVKISKDNTLMSSDVKERVRWYIKAHGHSSIGALNLISTMLHFTGRAKEAEPVDSAIRIFETFTDTEDLMGQLKRLKTQVDMIDPIIASEKAGPKKEELRELISGVHGNLNRIDSILKNPNYQERFKLSKIIFSAAHQLLKRYPNTLYGDLIGETGEHVGNRIMLVADEPSIEKEMLCSGYEIQLLVYNLLSNAVDAIHDKGKIFVVLHYTGSEVIITVSDDGDLINPEGVDRIMHHKEYSTKGPEHGHGMKIVYDILEKYGGRLEVDSDKGRHLVTFKAILPL